MKAPDPEKLNKAIVNEMRRASGLPPKLTRAERAEAARLNAAGHAKARNRRRTQKASRRRNR